MPFGKNHRHAMPGKSFHGEQISLVILDVPEDRRIEFMLPEPVELGTRCQIEETYLRFQMPLLEFPTSAAAYRTRLTNPSGGRLRTMVMRLCLM